MAKDIVMNVLTSTGYEPMYPFNPALVLNGTFLNTSTSSQYNITITSIPSPLTNNVGNKMGIIGFIPTVNNVDNVTLSINGSEAKPILFSDGVAVRANTLVANRWVFVKYYNNNFYLILDKNQIGLGNVDNTADIDKPVSTAVINALQDKLNIPILIPENSNLNSYTTAGLYYNNTQASAATITNTPIQAPFSLFVERHNGVKQTFTNSSTAGIQTWIRNYANNTWSEWYQQAIILTGATEPDPTVGMDGNLYLKIDV